jgi:hypothetical protein
MATSLVAAANTSSEPLRGVISIMCIGLAVYQWTIYRRGQRFSLPGFVLLTLTMVSLWLGLNVIRYYTYPRHSMGILGWHGLVIRTQELLMWPILCAVLIVTLWAIIDLAHWIARRVS